MKPLNIYISLRERNKKYKKLNFVCFYSEFLNIYLIYFLVIKIKKSRLIIFALLLFFCIFVPKIDNTKVDK